MSRPVRLVVPVLLAALAAAPSVLCAAEPARLMPSDASIYGEYRSPKVFLDLLEGWLRTVGGPVANGLDEPLGELARELEMEPKELRAEIAGVKDVAMAITRIEPDRNFVGMLLTADMTQSPRLLAAVGRKVRTLSENPRATVEGVEIYGDNRDTFACVVEGHAMLSTKLDMVRDAVSRMKGLRQESLAGSARFRKIRQELDPKAAAVSFMDVPKLRAMLVEAQVDNKELAAIDVALDLDTVDCVVSSLHVDGKVALAKYSILLSGESRTCAVFRTRAAVRSVTKFFSADYGLVCAGTLVDGRAQWQALKDLVARVQVAVGEDDDFLEQITEVEEALGIRLVDELANVTEFALGVKAGAEGLREIPDMLYVLRVKDVARATNVMKKVEKAARDEMNDLVIGEERVNGVTVRYIAGEDADSDYAWAVLDDHLLLSNHRRLVTEALKTHAAGRCILDDRSARDVLARLQDPSSKLLLLNVAGFQAPGARNPNAPAPGMIGVTTLETDRRIDVVADFSSLGELMRFFVGVFMNAMGG